MRKFYKHIDGFNIYADTSQQFFITVTAEREGVTLSKTKREQAYFNSHDEFIAECPHFEDMVNTVIAEAKTNAILLLDKLSNTPEGEQLKAFEEWAKPEAGNVNKVGDNKYTEQTTQWRKTFTREQLITFFVREYMNS